MFEQRKVLDFELGGRQMRTPNPALCACMASMLVGCGTSVPEIQDIGDSAAGQQLVQAIVTNITCEVQDGINRIYKHRHRNFFGQLGRADHA